MHDNSHPPPVEWHAPTELLKLAPANESAGEPAETEFLWDTETKARLVLRAVGSARYLRDACTQIRLICWALGNGPVHHWRCGDPIEPLLAAVKLAQRFAAHNLSFDRAAWNLHMVPLGLPPILLELCADTSAMC